MSSAEEIRGRTRREIIFPSGSKYVIRPVWPVDLFRDGVLPKGTMTGQNTRPMEDEEFARFESSLLCRGVIEPRVFDQVAPDDMTNAIDIRDIPPDERTHLMGELIACSGLKVTAQSEAPGGSGFRDGESKEA